MATYPDRGLQRILAGSVNPVLRVTLYDQDGDPGDASGTLTCSIARADGTVIATDRATTDATGTGVYTCALTTAEALTLDVLTATWRISSVTRAVTYHRVVGGFIFTVEQLAQRAGMQEFDVAQMRAERDRITDIIEAATGIAWAPCYDLVTFEGHGHSRHALWQRPVRTLRSITMGSTVVDVTVDTIRLDKAAGVISGISFAGWCQIGIEHGHAVMPHDMRDAAITAAADRVLREYSTIGARTRSMTNDLGVTQQFSYAGPDHPTGLDEVDAVIMSYARARI